MIAVLKEPSRKKQMPTLWGLDPVGLHDHFWAARGVCVVRPGDQKPLADAAELFLLTDARTLAIFRLRAVLETLCWVRPSVLFLRLQSKQDLGYRESIITDDAGHFMSVKRSYGRSLLRVAKAALTTDKIIAERWRSTEHADGEWRRLRESARRARGEAARVNGRVYDRHDDSDMSRFVTDLIRFWKDPSRTIPGLKRLGNSVWAQESLALDTTVSFVDGTWIGAGRSINAGATVLGPAAIWDDSTARPQPPVLKWHEIEPGESELLASSPRAKGVRTRSLFQASKRAFDIVFSLCVLACTLPLYPLILAAIWIEDGRPFFFAHKRETRGGKEFGCLKFRSMRKDAEQIKEQLLKLNKADGPQFFMEDDPRLTRVGRFIRKTNLDELPQFLNVIAGHMSVVGPRPSPHKENQFCPTWREGRLSVRPGITGLWQVRRTRQAGTDFQEWIRYDLEYVQKASWRLDLVIILQTFRVLIGW